jgi:hypothetical protein
MKPLQKTAFRTALDKKFGGSLEKLGAAVDLSLSQKALSGRVDVSQSLMCLRVSNLLRQVMEYMGLELKDISAATGLSVALLLDINHRSVLVSTVKLSKAEKLIAAYCDCTAELAVYRELYQEEDDSLSDLGSDRLPIKG